MIRIEGKPFDFCPDDCYCLDIQIRTFTADGFTERMEILDISCGNTDVCKMWNEILENEKEDNQ